MKRRFVYLINPVSGTQKKELVRTLIQKRTKEEEIEFEIIPTNSAGDYDFMKDIIRSKGITDVIIAGGDGTVNQVVSSLRNEKVNFGIIPIGSGNGLAYTAGIPKNPSRALSVIFNGNATEIDAFTINDQFSCMLSGLGFDAHIAHEFANNASRGLLTYTQQSLFHYFKAHPYQFEIILDNFSFYTEAFFVSIANSNQFGNNFTIAPKASLYDGLLDIVVVQKMNKARLPFAILRQIRGNNELQQLVEDISSKNILYFQTPSLIIKNHKLAPFHIDGEPKATEEEYKINILKNCFRLLQPSDTPVSLN